MKVLFFLWLIAFCIVPNILNAQLAGTKWELVQIEDISSDIPLTSSVSYIIYFDTGTMNFNLQVNKCSTSYTIIGSELSFAEVTACTKACCDGDISEKLNFKGKFYFEISGNLLIISNDSRVFTFREA